MKSTHRFLLLTRTADYRRFWDQETIDYIEEKDHYTRDFGLADLRNYVTALCANYGMPNLEDYRTQLRRTVIEHHASWVHDHLLICKEFFHLNGGSKAYNKGCSPAALRAIGETLPPDASTLLISEDALLSFLQDYFQKHPNTVVILVDDDDFLNRDVYLETAEKVLPEHDVVYFEKSLAWDALQGCLFQETGRAEAPHCTEFMINISRLSPSMALDLISLALGFHSRFLLEARKLKPDLSVSFQRGKNSYLRTFHGLGANTARRLKRSGVINPGDVVDWEQLTRQSFLLLRETESRREIDPPPWAQDPIAAVQGIH